MPEALVARILAPSFVDGPGSRMAVFLQGCNLTCQGCHNPETIGHCSGCGTCLPACPGAALERRDGIVIHHPESCRDCGACELSCPASASPRAFSITPEALVDRYRTWAPFLDGITFSGGECSLQAPFLLAAAPLLRALGASVLLDTNGLMAPETLEALAAATDGFLFDLKGLDSQTHQRWTGQDNAAILANLKRAAALGKLVEVRTVLVPGLSDAPAELEGIARFVAGLPGEPNFRLSPYRHHGVRGPGLEWPEPTAEQIAESIARAQRILGGRLQVATAT